MLWILVAVLCVTVVALARQIGTLHLRLGPRGALELDDEGPPLGEPMEPALVRDCRERDVTIGAAEEAQLLLFVSPACPVCEAVLPAVPALAAGGGLRPYVVVDGDREDADTLASRRRLASPVVSAPELARALDVPGTPYALVVDRGVVRAKGTVNNLEQLEGLADTARLRIARLGQEAA